MIKRVETEKALNLEKLGIYTFLVEERWNKARIKSEIGKAHKVEVVAVKTLKVRGKKKAVITLKEGQKIEYEKPKKSKK